jgi:hypothetical protein
MTEEERTQTGKYSDEYQDELADCYAIMFVLLIACAVVYCMAKVVMCFVGE